MEHRYYKSCSDLPIYNFDKILGTQDLRYLIIGWDEEKDVKLDEGFDALRRWLSIHSEYSSLINDNTSFVFFQLKDEIMRMQTRIYFVEALALQVATRDMPEDVSVRYMEEISKWGVPINPKGDYKVELRKAAKTMRGAKMKLRLKRDALKKIEKDNEGSSNLIKQVVKLEQGLSRNNIDPKKTSVEKWVYLTQELKEMAQARRKSVA